MTLLEQFKILYKFLNSNGNKCHPKTVYACILAIHGLEE